MVTETTNDDERDDEQTAIETTDYTTGSAESAALEVVSEFDSAVRVSALEHTINAVFAGPSGTITPPAGYVISRVRHVEEAALNDFLLSVSFEPEADR
jgi:hypothetical protein